MPEKPKLPAAIPVPALAVVVVIDYKDAEALYQFILANQGKPHPAQLIHLLKEG
jgi:hypothetical protein